MKDATKKKIHLIGIGGSGLSAIALVLLEMGIEVSGSDRQVSPLTACIESAGGRVYIGHHSEQVLGADLVVRSSAIPDDNPEIQAARQAGIPILKRLEFLSQLTADKKTIAIAGTHGKTTTTAMIAWMMASLGFDPSYIIGGVSVNMGKNAHAGTGEYFVIEADEYDHMFLGLVPQIAVVTNIEHDHPDCFPTLQDYYQAFQDFAGRLTSNGVLIACADDLGVVHLLKSEASHRRSISYGLSSTKYNFRAENLLPTCDGGISFQVIYHLDEQYDNPKYPLYSPVNVTLQVPGEHNVQNALACLAVASLLDIPLLSATSSLAAYTGTGRRFEVRGKASGVTVIDDYAHHPTEIRVTLAAARANYPDQTIWVVWQPHTYSRTRLLADEFAQAFGSTTSHLVDHVIVTEIFASRETPPADGYSANQVAQAMRHPNVSFIAKLPQIHDYLLSHLLPGNVLLVLSAGDADQLSTQVLLDLNRQEKIATKKFSSSCCSSQLN